MGLGQHLEIDAHYLLVTGLALDSRELTDGGGVLLLCSIICFSIPAVGGSLLSLKMIVSQALRATIRTINVYS